MSATDDLIAAAKRAREVLRQVSLERRAFGPIATAAQSAAWELTIALRLFEDDKDNTPPASP